MNRDELTERMAREARSLVGTPWRHLGRQPGVGLDCLGLLIVVARRCGIVAPDYDEGNYGRLPSEQRLLAGLAEHADPVAGNVPFPGCVGVFRIAGRMQHVGLFLARNDGNRGLDLVHAYATARAVVAHRFASPWDRRLFRVLRLRESRAEALGSVARPAALPAPAGDDGAHRAA